MVELFIVVYLKQTDELELDDFLFIPADSLERIFGGTLDTMSQ